MRKATQVALALLLGLCAMSIWPSTALAAERLPPLAFIPANLAGDVRAPLADRRQALQQQLATFQAAATAFNDQPAESQSVDDFNTLQSQRSHYISAANAFNRDVAAAVASAAKRVELPAANVSASGEFYFVSKDGRKLTGEEATRLPLDGGTHAVTGPNGHITMSLPDETTFTLGPNSDMVLDEYVYDPVKSAIKAEAHFLKGTLRWVTGKVSHTKDVKIKLHPFSIGIRGTDFEARVEPDGAGYVKLFEGQLDLTENKTGIKVILQARQMIRFSADGILSKPASLIP